MADQYQFAIPIVIGIVAILGIYWWTLADRRGGLAYMKETIGFAKKQEVQKKNNIHPAPKDTRMIFHHAVKGQVIANGFAEKADGTWSVINKDGVASFDVASQPRLMNFNGVAKSGNTDELHFLADEQSHVERLKAENMALNFAIKKLQNERLSMLKTVGEHRIEDAKIQGKVNLNKYRGIRTVPSDKRDKQTSQPMIEGDEGGME